MTAETNGFRQGIDGRTRSSEAERRINLSAAACLGGPSGEDFLNYLKSITINNVAGPNISSDELRHIEGQRFIVALICRRVELGHMENSKK